MPFNPYKVFQGVFARYWMLGYRGISTGAKLCCIAVSACPGYHRLSYLVTELVPSASNSVLVRMRLSFTPGTIVCFIRSATK